MRRVFYLSLCLSLFPISTWASTRFDNEGTSQGYINALDCVGVNISCARSGITGTITITGAGSSADSLTVNTTAATDANFLDNLYLDWAIDTGASPDDITAKFNYAETLAGNPALLVGEVVFSTTGTTGGVLWEGAADTIEGLLQWAPTTSDRTLTLPDATDTLVGRDTTDTLTNKTMTAAANVLDADTAVALAADPADCATSTHFAVGVVASGAATCEAIADADVPNTITIDLAATATALAANGANCSASNAPLGVDASGAVESCTDFEEELTNSAGLLAALSDETGTGVAVFGTSPTFTTGLTIPQGGLSDDSIREADLMVVDAAGDEECLTYETTTGDFEWQSCGAGGGDSITVATVAATDPDFINGDIDWTLDTAATPDTIAATVACTGCVDSTDLADSISVPTDLTIPQGTGPTVDAAGEIAQDTTDDQLLYGATPRVLHYERQFCVTVEALEATDDNFPIWSPSENITLGRAYCHCRLGTCTTEADLTLETLQIGTTTVDDVGGTIDCEDTTTGDTATTLTSDNTVDALDVIRFDVDNAMAPATDTYTLCVVYTTDRL